MVLVANGVRHLRYFVAVSEEENVSRAAAKLRVSQPGISQQIHELEDEIGFLLFARTGKAVRLTVAGMVASEPIAALARKDYPFYHKHLRKMFATIGRKPRISSEHDSGTSLMAAVAAGHEFTLLPCCVWSVAGRHLKLIKVRPALPLWSYVALWRKDAETEPVTAFIAAALPGKIKSDRATSQGSAKKTAGRAMR